MRGPGAAGKRPYATRRPPFRGAYSRRRAAVGGTCAPVRCLQGGACPPSSAAKPRFSDDEARIGVRGARRSREASLCHKEAPPFGGVFAPSRRPRRHLRARKVFTRRHMRRLVNVFHSIGALKALLFTVLCQIDRYAVKDPVEIIQHGDHAPHCDLLPADAVHGVDLAVKQTACGFKIRKFHDGARRFDTSRFG